MSLSLACTKHGVEENLEELRQEQGQTAQSEEGAGAKTKAALLRLLSQQVTGDGRLSPGEQGRGAVRQAGSSRHCPHLNGAHWNGNAKS